MMAERTVKHLGFWYMVEVEDRYHPGQTRVIQRIASQGATVDIPREEDIERGEKFGAFYTEDELEQGKHLPQVQEETTEESAEEVDSVRDMSDDDLVSWLREDKPPAREVVDSAEGDPDLARRLMNAEDRATDGNSRKSVVQGLTTVIQSGA